MKIFKLKKLTYKNIMSVGQKPIVIELDKHHKTLITGKNGGGKSTMLEALTFGLFGKPFRDIKKGQLINTYNKKDLVVEIELSYNGNEFYIKRGQKPNILEITRNGELLKETSSVKDFQEYFEFLIGMTYNSFKQVVVLGTAGYTPFMQLSAPNRRKLVEDLLEVSVLAEIDKLNKTYIREINQQISVIDLRVEHLRTEIQTHKDYAEKQKKLSADNVARLQTMYVELKDEAKSAKTKIDSLQDIQVPEDPTPELNEINRKITQTKTEGAQFKKVLDLFDKGGCCPTCMQPLTNLDHKVKQGYESSVTQEASLVESKSKVERLYVEFKNLQQDANSVNLERRELKAKIQSAVEKANKVKAAIEKASEQIIDNSDKILSLQTELDEVLTSKSELVVAKYDRGLVTEMLKDSGIKGSIVQKYIPLFNKRINHYLKMLEADYVFTLDEEFSESIKSRGREEFSYASFSQGEKGRIDLALLFTWRDIAELVSGVRISCLFLDEVTDTAGLDAQGFRNLSIILNEMSDFNFFIISHRDQDTSNYQAHIKMKKVGRFTVVE